MKPFQVLLKAHLIGGIGRLTHIGDIARQIDNLRAGAHGPNRRASSGSGQLAQHDVESYPSDDSRKAVVLTRLVELGEK